MSTQATTDTRATRPDEFRRRTPVGFVLVLAASAILATLGSARGAEIGAAVTVAVVLLVAGALLGIERTDTPFAGPRLRWIPAALVMALIIGSAGAINVHLLYSFAVAALGSAGFWCIMVWRPLTRTGAQIIVACSLSVLGVVAFVALIVVEPPDIDVISVGEEGADALRRGENPYAVVVVEDTNPFVPEGSTFDGYVYPPVTLVGYSASYWILGDIRWASVIAIGVFILLLGGPWRAKAGSASKIGPASALAFVLLPMLGPLLRHGWTEPLAMPLLAGAALSWRKRPILAALLLGVAIASKQYFILLAPLLLIWNDDDRWRRVGVVAGVVIVTALPFALMDPQALWDAAVSVQFGRDLRPDSVNVIALGFHPPQWLPAVAATGLGLVLGRRGGDGVEFAIGAAAVLSVAFLFGFQAFPNYWVLVVALAATALCVASVNDETLHGAEGAAEQDALA